MKENTKLRFGSEVYTWFMAGNGETNKGKLGHMIEVIGKAGFTGIQPIFTWMGDLVDPILLKNKLDENGIELAALALALEWNGATETDAEKQIADNAIQLLTHFPNAVLNTVQIPTGRHDLETRQKTLVNIVNQVSKRAVDAGIACSFHPNSPHSSIIRTEQDYKIVLESLDTPAKIKVLGGFTGSGKTHILNELHTLGHQMIDLEGLAHHKGSAFGGIGQPQQPTVEQFENNLYNEFRQLDVSEPIWVEDESYDIGKVKIPKPFYEQMQQSQLYFIDIPQNERAKHLVNEYGNCDKQKLTDSIHRISQRLGGLSVKNAIAALEQDDFYEVAMITLHYYDKLYSKGMNNPKWKKVHNIPFPTINHYENALKLDKLK